MKKMKVMLVIVSAGTVYSHQKTLDPKLKIRTRTPKLVGRMTETITGPQSEIQVTSTWSSLKETAAFTTAHRESILITDKRGNPIQPEQQPQNRPRWIEATATQRTDTMESIARIIIDEGGISILEGAMVMAATRFRQAIVRRDLPPGAINCP